MLQHFHCSLPLQIKQKKYYPIAHKNKECNIKFPFKLLRINFFYF